MLWAGEEASPAGVELSCSLEKIAHQNQGERDRECRECLPRGAPPIIIFSAVWSAMVVVRSGVSYMLWRGALDA